MNKLSSLAAMLLVATTSFAQANIDRCYPSAVGPGETTITAEGKLPSWPCNVFCDRNDIKITPTEKPGQLTVNIAENTPPGLAWIRLYDDKTSSNLVPLLIESVAVTPEPADSHQPIALPAVVTGRLAKSGEVDAVQISLNAGDQLVASLIGNQILDSPMDALLQLADLKGNVLSQSDDVRGLDPQLTYLAAADIDLHVRVFAFPSTPNSTVGFSGSSGYVYALRLTTGPFLDHVLPTISGQPVDTAMPVGSNLPEQTTIQRCKATAVSPPIWYSPSALGWQWQPSIDPTARNVLASTDPATHVMIESLPAVMSGQITEPKQVDRARFSVAKGKKYSAQLHAKSSGFLLDAVLRVIDVKSGSEVVRKDDNSRTDFDAVVSFTAKSDAEYELQVSDAVESFGSRHAYAVLVQEAIPDLEMTVAADHFLLAPGGSVEIPVTVSRVNGFAEKVRVTATDLPDGVKAAPVISESKGETAKSVKLKLTATDSARFNGNIQIVGTVIGSDDQPTEQTRLARYALRPEIKLPAIWLTVGK